MNLRFKPTAKIGQFFVAVPTSQKMRLCVDVIHVFDAIRVHYM